MLQSHKDLCISQVRLVYAKITNNPQIPEAPKQSLIAPFLDIHCRWCSVHYNQARAQADGRANI